jgi:hypothetical protein
MFTTPGPSDIITIAQVITLAFSKAVGLLGAIGNVENADSPNNSSSRTISRRTSFPLPAICEISTLALTTR